MAVAEVGGGRCFFGAAPFGEAFLMAVAVVEDFPWGAAWVGRASLAVVAGGISNAVCDIHATNSEC